MPFTLPVVGYCGAVVSMILYAEPSRPAIVTDDPVVKFLIRVVIAASTYTVAVELPEEGFTFAITIPPF